MIGSAAARGRSRRAPPAAVLPAAAQAAPRCRRSARARRSRAAPPGRRRPSCSAPSSPVVSGVSGSSTTTISARGSRAARSSHRVHPRAGVARDADQLDLEPLQPCLDGARRSSRRRGSSRCCERARSAGAAPSGARAGGRAARRAPSSRRGSPRAPTRRPRCRGCRRRRRAVTPGGASRQQPVDAGRERLQHPQPRHAPQQLEHASIAGGRDEELRVEDLRRQLAVARDQAERNVAWQLARARRDPP